MLTRSTLFSLLLLAILPTMGQTNRSCGGFRYVFQIFAGTSQTTVQYGEATQGGNTEMLFMDVYQPEGDTFSSRAVMILAHGGDFASGDRADMADLARQFAEHGYVAATIDYRLQAAAPTDSMEMASALVQSMHDLKAAVRFFRDDQQNAKTYRIDTNFVFVGGYSAGALAALHAAYLSDGDVAPGYFETALSAEGGLEGQSNNITGASSRIQAVMNLAGGLVDRSWIQSSEAPLISYHGENDQVVPTNGGLSFGVINLDGSALIHQEADQKNVFNYYQPVVGGTHDSLFAGSFATGYQEFLDSAFVSLFDVLCNEVTSIRSAVSEPTLLSLYPNPASRSITVNYPGPDRAELLFYNSQGACVKTENLSAPGTRLNLDGMSPGVYFVVLRTQAQGLVSRASLVVEGR